jgi:hypothetical protein
MGWRVSLWLMFALLYGMVILIRTMTLAYHGARIHLQPPEHIAPSEVLLARLDRLLTLDNRPLGDAQIGLLRRAIYHTYMDCIDVGLRDEARARLAAHESTLVDCRRSPENEDTYFSLR